MLHQIRVDNVGKTIDWVEYLGAAFGTEQRWRVLQMANERTIELRHLRNPMVHVELCMPYDL